MVDKSLFHLNATTLWRQTSQVKISKQYRVDFGRLDRESVGMPLRLSEQ